MVLDGGASRSPQTAAFARKSHCLIAVPALAHTTPPLVRFGTALQNRSELGRPIDGILERPTTRDPAREARCQYPAAIHFRANPRLDKTPPLSRALPGGFGALRNKREDRGITAATCPDAY